ncbi:MAG: phosphoribosylanthranilate isomerase [Actinomycetota bacterium]|nr:phosphoribosylanthranilate isomerase [Actinomycetota bacterium]
MTWVKVCGMTSDAAIESAVVAGADAIGLVLDSRSPRSVTIEVAGELVAGLTIASFIVTVDYRPGEALAAAETVGATGIQPHGDHSLEVVAAALKAGYLTLAPVPVGPDGPLIDWAEIPDASMLLYDTASADRHGGTGTVFDWTLLGDPGRPFVLAGGLGVDNVAAAIEEVQPFGVDASSRLESVPGVKDLSRIVDFIREAKTA